MEADDEEQDQDDEDLDEETLDDLSQEGKNSVSKIIIKQDNGMRSFFPTLISTCFCVKNAFFKKHTPLSKIEASLVGGQIKIQHAWK